MTTIRNALTSGQALLVGLGIIGCTTALAVTGHISGDTAINTMLVVGGGAIGIAGAHVGGTVATNATNAAAPPAPGQAAPAQPTAGATATAPVQPVNQGGTIGAGAG